MSTPLMNQYQTLKEEAGQALLLFRMGDFYELFGEDAIVAAKILDIALTSRDKSKENAIPMAGVPHHSIQSYLHKLLQAGKKVAIAEQVEDPAIAKGIVERKIVRTFSPAVQFNSVDHETSYLGTLSANPAKKDEFFLTLLEPGTGEILVSKSSTQDELAEKVFYLPLKHFLHLQKLTLEENFKATLKAQKILVESLPDNFLRVEQAIDLCKRSFSVATLDSYFLSQEQGYGVGLLIQYTLRSQQVTSLPHLLPPRSLEEKQGLDLSVNASDHLDLPELFALIDSTKSALGSRQLKRWIYRPLSDHEGIQERQNAVRTLSERAYALRESTKLFSRVYDIQRILGRIGTKLANPRDTYNLGQSLSVLPEIQKLMVEENLINPSKELQKIHKESESSWSNSLEDLTGFILNAQNEQPPLNSKDGGIFKKGFRDDLDRLIALTEEGESWLIELEAKERSQTGIPSLKVKYNRVFGYFIEVTKTHLKNVPSHYQRKQSTVNAERFFTEELKKFEDEIISAHSKRKSLEQKLFEDLLEKISSHFGDILKAAQVLGDLDALFSLARLSDNPGWTFPVIDQSFDLDIEGGRHPVVDANTEKFVPNALRMNAENRQILLITGPNMGGKSTIMRQAALIILLGQAGAPVPAARAQWGCFSSIYTRIGAQDAISKGQSTFMVEMSELARILHQADSRSLIVLDEIGRGTSTYDGMSVAWATVEWISKSIGARTLFATHYHELTQLADELLNVCNTHMGVETQKRDGKSHLRFTYELREGPTNESFGIYVAQLAGIPKGVIKKSLEVLERLEEASSQKSASPHNPGQLSFFLPEQLEKAPQQGHPLVKEIETLDINQFTPLEALNYLATLKKRSSESDSKFA